MTETIRADVALIVAGEDWSGNVVPRVLDAQRIVTLRGAFGEGFDIHGPHAAMCGDCGVPIFATTGGSMNITRQRHQAVHGASAPLLSR
jgi:hypothetical protein